MAGSGSRPWLGTSQARGVRWLAAAMGATASRTTTRAAPEDLPAKRGKGEGAPAESNRTDDPGFDCTVNQLLSLVKVESEPSGDRFQPALFHAIDAVEVLKQGDHLGVLLDWWIWRCWVLARFRSISGTSVRCRSVPTRSGTALICNQLHQPHQGR